MVSAKNNPGLFYWSFPYQSHYLIVRHYLLILVHNEKADISILGAYFPEIEKYD